MTALLSLDIGALIGLSGRGVRVAIVDSGIATGHPHVGAVRAGVWLRDDGEDPDTRDQVGHGTAVAAAIREKAPGAVLIPVRVFERRLATTATTLARAIAWAAHAGAHLVNISLGTRNVAHAEPLEDAIREAGKAGVVVVGAAEWAGERLFPGSLPGAIGVRADPTCPRDTVRIGMALGDGLRAAPSPRPIPGVPEGANLSGVSFAVANATGLLALLLEGAPDARSAEALHDRLLAVAAPARHAGCRGPVGPI